MPSTSAVRARKNQHESITKLPHLTDVKENKNCSLDKFRLLGSLHLKTVNPTEKRGHKVTGLTDEEQIHSMAAGSPGAAHSYGVRLVFSLVLAVGAFFCSRQFSEVHGGFRVRAGFRKAVIATADWIFRETTKMRIIMMSRSFRYSSLIVATLGLGMSGASVAATDSANMVVSASVADNCLINAAPLNFGSYDPVGAHAASALAGTSTIGVTCTNGALADITLSEGSNADSGSTADVPLRRLVNGASMLAYNLYQDEPKTLVWGGTALTGVDHTGTGSEAVLTVYGVIPAGQSGAAAGSYSDTVVATVTF